MKGNSNHAQTDTSECCLSIHRETTRGGDGTLCGGLSGSISEIDGVLYAYIAAVALIKGAPQKTGTYITIKALDCLEKKAVKQVNLGTQTAENFYEKQGFNVTHHMIADLRFRIRADGNVVRNNLVIMEKTLIRE